MMNLLWHESKRLFWEGIYDKLASMIKFEILYSTLAITLEFVEDLMMLTQCYFFNIVLS